MSAEEPTRRLAAILAADVVSYTRLVESDEAGTLAAWRALQARLTEDVVVTHRGRIFKNTVPLLAGCRARRRGPRGGS